MRVAGSRPRFGKGAAIEQGERHRDEDQESFVERSGDR